MRRSRLIWFAMGLTLGVLIPILTGLLLPSDIRPASTLILTEPVDVGLPPTSQSEDDAALREYRGPALARECGVDEFQISLPSHGGAQTEIEIDSTHPNALNCLNAKATSAGVGFNFARTAS